MKNILYLITFLILFSCNQPIHQESKSTEEQEEVALIPEKITDLKSLLNVSDSFLVDENHKQNEFQLDLSETEIDKNQSSKIAGKWTCEIGGLSFLKTDLKQGNKVVFIDKVQSSANGWGILKYNILVKFYFTESSSYQYEYYIDNSGFLNLIEYKYRNEDLSFKSTPEGLKEKIKLSWIGNEQFELSFDDVKFLFKKNN